MALPKATARSLLIAKEIAEITSILNWIFNADKNGKRIWTKTETSSSYLVSLRMVFIMTKTNLFEGWSSDKNLTKVSLKEQKWKFVGLKANKVKISWRVLKLEEAVGSDVSTRTFMSIAFNVSHICACTDLSIPSSCYLLFTTGWHSDTDILAASWWFSNENQGKK